MAVLTKKQRHSLLIEWLSDELIDIKQTMKELDLIDFWSDEQADLYEELEYRKEFLLKQINDDYLRGVMGNDYNITDEYLESVKNKCETSILSDIEIKDAFDGLFNSTLK
jgi:hypothetical protein